jgi:hypothetical protein
MPSEIQIYGDTSLFGFGIRFETTRPGLLDAALALYPEHEGVSDCEPSIYVVLETYEVKEIAPDNVRIDGMELSVVRDGIFLRADGARQRGACIFPNVLPDKNMVRESINTVAMYLVAQAGRIPVHASAVMFGDRAIVLAGQSGAGKSSLAMAADRAGYPVLSDDTIFVQTKPEFCIWALPQAIHVFEKDAPAGAANGMRFRSGRWKHTLPITAPRHRAEQAVLCVLARGDIVTLEPIPEADAVGTLTRDPEPGYEFYGDRAVEAVCAVARGGTWKLTLARDPDAAIAALAAAFSGHVR